MTVLDDAPESDDLLPAYGSCPCGVELSGSEGFVADALESHQCRLAAAESSSTWWGPWGAVTLRTRGRG